VSIGPRALPLCAALLLAFGAPALAQSLEPEAALVHHPVNTKSTAAQRYFDEGLTLVYAFNRDEARKRFESAAALDPKLAMAFWGVALAEGPNLNFPMESPRLAIANAALEKAKALAGGASPEERRYIEALVLRYPNDPKVPAAAYYLAYRDAMLRLSADYPADDDAAALAVESAMDVDEWGWVGGVPVGPTASLAATLETVLRRNPGHIGANHFYVHLMDFQGVAERAVPSARRLSVLPIEPAASHLVHMAGHTDLDVGNFSALLREERAGVEMDLAYAAASGVAPGKLDYFTHDLSFFTGAAVMLGDATAIDDAIAICKNNHETLGMLAYARLGRWQDVLAWPAPSDRYGLVRYHYARVLAFTGLGDAARAQGEFGALESAVPPGDGSFFAPLLGMARANLAYGQGDRRAAVSELRAAIEGMGQYPPEVYAPWFYPAGEWLGWILLHAGDTTGAETAFRNDLVRTPHNARALFGLMESLGFAGRLGDARGYAGDVAANWRGPIAELRLGNV